MRKYVDMEIKYEKQKNKNFINEIYNYIIL